MRTPSAATGRNRHGSHFVVTATKGSVVILSFLYIAMAFVSIRAYVAPRAGDADPPSRAGRHDAAADSRNEDETIPPITASATMQPPAPSPSFQRHESVAIVSKVLSGKHVHIVCQWLCYISHAYNDRMNYDVIIFTTLPWSQENIEMVQSVAGNKTQVTVAMEGPPLEERLAALTEDEVKALWKRCNVKESLTWRHYCTEEGSRHGVSLGYAWQAEFRSYHIWNHPALRHYKYMMWLDNDCRMRRTWNVDPIQIFIENNLVLLYNQFPKGHTTYAELTKKMQDAYNASICRTTMNDRGELHAEMCGKDTQPVGTVNSIGGHHHITDLAVFRKDVHQRFLRSMVGDYPFERKYDDQLAVTVVPLMEQHLRARAGGDDRAIAWHERFKNLTLDVYHHRMFDGDHHSPASASGKKYWRMVKKSWPGLHERCKAWHEKK